MTNETTRKLFLTLIRNLDDLGEEFYKAVTKWRQPTLKAQTNTAALVHLNTPWTDAIDTATALASNVRKALGGGAMKRDIENAIQPANDIIQTLKNARGMIVGTTAKVKVTQDYAAQQFANTIKAIINNLRSIVRYLVGSTVLSQDDKVTLDENLDALSERETLVRSA
jgi:hypothetical protein